MQNKQMLHVYMQYIYIIFIIITKPYHVSFFFSLFFYQFLYNTKKSGRKVHYFFL